jgi:DNA-binding MarR family transcriptional regulator
MLKAVAKAMQPVDREGSLDHVRPHYLETLTLVERLHRRLLDVIKDEFDRRSRADINSVQALLLYNIGEKDLTAGELRTRGYYLGSNVSYNLKKLVEMGYLDHQRSRIDRRSVRIKLTDKGREVRDIVDMLYQKHVGSVAQVGGIGGEEFAAQQVAAAPRAVLDRSDPLPVVIAVSGVGPLPRHCRGMFFSPLRRGR